MYEKIVRLAFEKAEINTVGHSFSALANYIETEIDKLSTNNHFNAKTYKRYYEKYVSKGKSEFDNPNQKVFDGLAIFLGFESFEDFKAKNVDEGKITSEQVELNDEKVSKANKEEKAHTTTEVIIKSKSKLLKAVLASIILFVIMASSWIIIDLIMKNNAQPNKTTINYNTYNGNLNYYYSKKDNGEIIFYEEDGIVAGEKLKPVSKEIILTSFKQQHIEVADEDVKRWFKETDVEKIAPINDKEISTAENFTKIQEKKSLNLATTNGINIKSSGIVDSGMSSFFKEKYDKTTENYTVLGDVIYNFKPSSYSTNMVVCELTLSYEVSLLSTNEVFDLSVIKCTATGTSNDDAKNRAIEKIEFK